MSWHFHPMSPGDLNIDPTQGEFFTTETLGGITDALVREAIQNSLDAEVDDKIRVRFCLGVVGDSVRERYLGSLVPHARAAFEASTGIPGQEERLRFLAIEDAGTRGLRGDPNQYEDDSSVGDRNDFYYFWRNVGRSRKGSSERGRWGLGKTVFAEASRLKAFLGMTTRDSDGRTLLMGQAVLRIHRIGDSRCRPYGYYGIHDNGFTRPIDDADATADFARSFMLERLNGPGLSIVIPHPDEDITAEGLIMSVLRHYFHPLLAEKLEVAIRDEDGNEVLLRGHSLEYEIARQDAVRHLLPLVRLARWGADPEPEAIATLSSPPAGAAQRFSERLFDEADLNRLRSRYDEGRRVALDFRLTVEPVDEPPKETGFRLLMERDQQDQRGEGHFVRQGITIENPNARRPRGVRWILIASDQSLVALLGDAENPAHTEWQRNSPKLKQRYHRGSTTLDFVRAAPHHAAQLLSRPGGERDQHLLRDIFSLSAATPVSTQQASEPVPDGAEHVSMQDSIPSTIGSNGAISLSRIKSGFRLRGRLDEPGPLRLEVTTAYDVLRGNPFQRYSPLDFHMDKTIDVEARGARVITRHDNRLEVEIGEGEFEVAFTGFDENRDLRVKVKPLETSQ